METINPSDIPDYRKPDHVVRRNTCRNRAIKAAVQGDQKEVIRHNIEMLMNAPPLARTRAIATIKNLEAQLI